MRSMSTMTQIVLRRMRNDRAMAVQVKEEEKGQFVYDRYLHPLILIHKSESLGVGVWQRWKVFAWWDQLLKLE